MLDYLRFKKLIKTIATPIKKAYEIRFKGIFALNNNGKESGYNNEINQ